MSEIVFVNLGKRKLVGGLQELIDELVKVFSPGADFPLLGRLDAHDQAPDPLVMAIAGHYPDEESIFRLTLVFYNELPKPRPFRFSFEPPRASIEVMWENTSVQVAIPTKFVRIGALAISEA